MSDEDAKKVFDSLWELQHSETAQHDDVEVGLLANRSSLNRVRTARAIEILRLAKLVDISSDRSRATLSPLGWSCATSQARAWAEYKQVLTGEFDVLRELKQKTLHASRKVVNDHIARGAELIIAERPDSKPLIELKLPSLGPELHAVVSNAIKELSTAVENKQYLAALVLMGSIAEGLLYNALDQHPGATKARKAPKNEPIID